MENGCVAHIRGCASDPNADGAGCSSSGAHESGRIHKGAFVCWAMQLLSVTVHRGNAKMHRRSGLVISGEQGLHYES